jgi:O-antigen ligase
VSIREKLANRILQALFFLAPTQFGYHFWPEWAHIFGIRVDYFAPTIFLTDLLILAFIFLRAGKIWSIRNKFQFWLPIAGFAVLNVIFAANPQLAIYKWIKVGEYLAFVMSLLTLPKENIAKLIYIPVQLSLIFFSTIGIIQTMLGHTLGGTLYFLGERVFGISTPGIALANFFGNNILRGYSTFAHPNALAGYLIVATLIALWSKNGKPVNILDKAALFLAGVAIVFSFSLAALVAVFFVIILWKKIKYFSQNSLSRLLTLMIVLSIVMPIISTKILTRFSVGNESVEQRLELNTAAGKMFAINPLLGVGNGNYIIHLPTSLSGDTAWWLQPVHNIFLLVLAEDGIVGLLVLMGLMLRALKQRNKLLMLGLFAVVVTGFVDHYWLTLQQNQILLSILLTLSFI